MKKKCFSCGAPFALSGFGKLQKYCSKCARRGNGRGRGLPGSNPLRTKAANAVREQVLTQRDKPNPISFVTPDGRKGKVWLGTAGVADDFHWRVQVAEAIKIAEIETKERGTGLNEPADLVGGRYWKSSVSKALRNIILDTELHRLTGFRVRLCFNDEVPAIGSGWRVVTCQFRGGMVILHHAGYAGTIKRDVFKERVAATRRCIERNAPKRPQLTLVVSNPPKFDEGLSDVA
jgi:hypothetical protein